MSLFHWFSRRTPAMRKEARRAAKPLFHGGSRSDAAPPPSTGCKAESPEERRKVRRHARREQMYVAIREAMTRAGVLSASYRFKVLSLDPAADAFLVMMDLQSVTGDTPPLLAPIELLIMQSARLRFDISVSAVYWRVHEVESFNKPLQRADVSPATPTHASTATPVPGPKTPCFEPVQADEVAAFQRALLTATAQSRVAAAEKVGKTRSWLRSSAHLVDDFKDTEVTEPESSPLLSTTQYGELN